MGAGTEMEAYGVLDLDPIPPSLYQFAFERNPAGLCLAALDTTIVAANAALRGTVDIRSTRRAVSILDLVHADDRGGIETMHGALLADERESYAVDVRLRVSDRGYQWMNMQVALLRHDRYPPVLHCQLADVSARIEAMEHAQWAASHDALTGLANRVLLHESLEQALHRSSGAAVLFIDLDGFKSVNDEHGHECGDVVLVETARRLRRAIRSSDTAARLSGDEFVVVLEGVGGSGEAVRAGERIRRLLAAPVALPAPGSRRPTVSITSSVGVCTTVEAPIVPDPGAMIRAADLAMYGAKARGGDQVAMAPVDHLGQRADLCVREPTVSRGRENGA